MGLALAGIGFLVWAVASIIYALTDAAKDTNPEADPTPWLVVLIIGFAVMVGGPALYWFVLPIAGWIRRRRHKEVTPSLS